MRILIGILIILFGLQMALTSAGVDNIPSVGDWWPVVLLAIAVISWRSNPHAVFGPIILFILGVAFLLSNLEVLPGNGWNYLWPVIVILIGLRILYGKQWGKRDAKHGNGKDIVVTFSGHEEQVGGSYNGGNITAIFGGTKLDLRQADIQDNATIEVFAAFGGAEIYVPTSVNVTTNVSPIFGGASNKTKPAHDAYKTLRVVGTALFGGVDVKN